MARSGPILMERYIDLERRFGLITDYSPESLLMIELPGRRLNWADVLRGKYSLIVGRANFGKTTELRTQATALRTRGEHAIFVRLHNVLDQAEFSDALAAEDARAFELWRQTPDASLTVFVDSLDEASLSHEEGLRRGLRLVSRSCDARARNVKWIISTRPAVLTPPHLLILESELGVNLYSERGDSDQSKAPSDIFKDEEQIEELANTVSATSPGTGVDSLRLYSLLRLDTASAKRYLKQRYNANDPSALLGGARSYGLTGLTDGPGGLDVLANIDLIDRPPECLTDAFERMVGALERLQRADPREARMQGPLPASLDEAIQRLACASALCQILNIELLEDPLRSSSTVLSARQIVGSSLTEPSLKLILGSRLFIDVGHHQVKLYPDELLPFLAAKRLALLVQSPEDGARLVRNLSWTAPTGEGGVCRQYLTIAGWLATLSKDCRHALLTSDPQVVAFFGDLRNPAIPLSDAIAAITGAIERIANDADPLGRDFFRPTQENYWQANKPGLGPTLLTLFQRHREDWRGHDALHAIATYGRNEALRDDVLRSHDCDYSKLIHNSDDVHYLAALGRSDDAAALRDAILKASDLREDIVALALHFLAWRTLSAEEMAGLAGRYLRKGNGGFRVGWTLKNEVLESGTSVQRFQLVRATVRQLIQEGGGNGSDRRRGGERSVELASELLAAIIESEEDMQSSRAGTVRLCLILQLIISTQYLGSVDLGKLRQAFTKNPEVRLEFLRAILRRSGSDASRVEKAIFGYGHICPFLDGDDVALDNPTLDEVLQHRRRRDASTQRAEKIQRRVYPDFPSDLVDRIRLRKDEVRAGEATEELAAMSVWLTRSRTETAFGSFDFGLLERALADPELVGAIRAGLSAIWRLRPPELGDPGMTRGSTIAGLQGLQLDLGGSDPLPRLTTSEVHQALWYGRFELDRYPGWFWSLAEDNTAVAIDNFTEVLESAGDGPVAFEHAEKLVRHLDRAHESIRTRLSEQIWHFILTYPGAPDHIVTAALQTIKASVHQHRDQFEEHASARIKSAYHEHSSAPDEGALDRTNDKEVEQAESAEDSSRRNRRQRAAALPWGAAWLAWFPDSFGAAWLDWHATQGPVAKQFLYDLAADLGHGYAKWSIDPSGDSCLPTLELLYRELHAIVRPEDDADHSDGEVYRVSDRDHAERFRDAIPPMLVASLRQEGYDILDRLRRESVGQRAKYLRSLQWQMQENRFAPLPLLQSEYGRFESDLTGSLTNYQGFARAVHNDLLEVKYEIEKGEFSLRRFFNSIKYEVLKTPEGRLALEEDFQTLLGSEINHASKQRYVVTLESRLPEATRRDLLCRKDNYYASVELKMSERWTLNDYLESLEHQLVGQYMKARNSRIGFFVIVLQRKRIWIEKSSKSRLGFGDVIVRLQARATELIAQDHTLDLRVIGIDATSPDDFRAQKQKRR